MSRRFLSFLLRRVEGALWIGLMAFLFPGLLAASVARLSRGRAAARKLPAIWKASWRRWALFVVRGLSPVRLAWWPALNYEPQRNVWGYVVLLELFDLLNVVGPDTCAGDPPDPARVLVVKLAHVGDALHVVPALRMLKEKRPGWSLDLLAGPWCEALARKIPYLDGYVPCTPRLVLFNRGRCGRRAGWLREVRFLWGLRRQGYAWLFSTSVTSLVELCLIHAVRPAWWVGAAPNLDLWFPFSEARTRPYTSRQYEAQRIADLLPLVGIPAPRAALEYAVDEASRAAARARLCGLGIATDRTVVAIAPGAGWPGKLWPAERFAAVADRLAAGRGAAIVLIGSAAERDLAEQVRAAMRTPAANLAGETSLDDMAALLAASSLLIGNDSAPVHFAVAVGTPSLALFGPTSRAQWGAPEGGVHRVLVATALCPDCHPFHPLARCEHDRICMKSIPVESVVSAAEEMLGKNPPPIPPGRGATHPRPLPGRGEI